MTRAVVAATLISRYGVTAMSKQRRDLDQQEVLALRKFVFWAAGFGDGETPPENYDIHDAVADASRRFEKIEQIEERMDQLEHGWAQLVTDLPTSKQSKREKLYSVVEYAIENGRTWSGGAMVTKDAAAGAADCSPRHALNLFNDLERQFEWAEKDISGDQAKLKIDKGDRETAAFLDMVTTVFEGVDEQ